MHTVYCPAPRIETDSLDISTSSPSVTEPARSSSGLVYANPPFRFGFLTVEGDGFKTCWLIDDNGPRIVSCGVPVLFQAMNNVSFCQTASGGATSLLLTYSDRNPIDQNRFSNVTVKP